MPLAPGTRIGSYDVLAALGAGGMGEVYRARDRRLGREIALKVLPAALADHPDRLVRLEREARAVAGLNHPNIVTLYSFEEVDGVRFLTLELVDGASLDRLVVAGGLPLPRVLELAIPLADALAAAHDRGIVHRDLKPGNVMVTREGRVKVLDFGLAKLTAPDSDPDATQAATVAAPVSSAGDVVGTVPYMAPEQLRGETVDARADLFSFGILLYELLTGRRPFTGATSADVTSAILRDVPLRLLTLRPELPRDLDRIVARCLEKEPRDRFQTARDVYNELRYLAREALPAGAHALAPDSGSRAAPSGAGAAAGAAASFGTAPAASATHAAPASGALAPASDAARAAPSIAVLPFVNRSRDAEDEYFSDGLADELLGVLAKVRGLRVAARSSSFQFKGQNEDLAVIGRKLNVATLLEGSVRKAGPRVRITVQLVKVADGFQLWSETYDRTLEDIFAVQDDIAQAVVKELRATLMGAEPDSRASGEARAAVEAAAKGRGGNSEAHRLFLQGRHLMQRVTRGDTERGIAYLRQALELDPTHALAWATLARAYVNVAGYSWDDIEAAYARARAAALRAIEVEPRLAEGYAALGRIQTVHDWDWAAAQASYGRALELAPSSADVLHGACLLAQSQGRLEEATRLALRSVEVDPLNPSSYGALGHAYRSSGRLEEARVALTKMLELSPHRAGARMLFSSILVEMGRLDEALVEANAEGESWARACALAIVHAAAGRREESDQALKRLIEGNAQDAAYQIAITYADRGEADPAFEWLERSYAQRDPGLSWVKAEPLFRPIHGDPRWGAFLQKMGLAD